MESRETSPRPQHHPLAKTAVPPNHHRTNHRAQNPFAATVHAPNHGKIRSVTDQMTYPFEPRHQNRHQKVLLGEHNKEQKAASNSGPRPITLAPDPSHSRMLASDSPNRASPLGIGLVCNLFVTQRQSPLALNLSHKRPLVTTPPTAGGGPRRRLFIGRCPTRNLFSRTSRNAVATATKTRAGVPPSAKDSGRACSEGASSRSWRRAARWRQERVSSPPNARSSRSCRSALAPVDSPHRRRRPRCRLQTAASCQGRFLGSVAANRRYRPHIISGSPQTVRRAKLRKAPVAGF